MNKKPKVRYKDSIGSWSKNSYAPSFSPPDPIEEERYAQLQEHRGKQKKEVASFSEKNHKHNANKNSKSRVTDLKESLEKTWKWLSETFPVLFGRDTTIRLLNTHIVRDIKNHYKCYQVQNHYPKDLIIKATISRYMEKPEYLRCLQEGASKYNIYGTAVETVTKAEQERALQLLK